MSSTADMSDAAISLQASITDAEQQLGQAALPDWFTDLRDNFHRLVSAIGWSENIEGTGVIGFRCEGRTHAPECVAYRAALGDHDGELTTCPKCGAEVHGLFEAGPTPYACWPCWKDNEK